MLKDIQGLSILRPDLPRSSRFIHHVPFDAFEGRRGRMDVMPNTSHRDLSLLNWSSPQGKDK